MGEGISWLDPNTVPTMGDYFRAAGYQTYYHGKWHISEADILIPGTWAGRSVRSEMGNTNTVPNEYELYNLTRDPLEVTNLAHPGNATVESRAVRSWLAELLAERRRTKRLSPAGRSLPKMPS